MVRTSWTCWLVTRRSCFVGISLLSFSRGSVSSLKTEGGEVFVMLVFVYGTLRPRWGHELGRKLGHQGDFKGRAFVSGALYDYGDYPVAIPSVVRGNQIHGELFDLDAGSSIWRELDDYEDYHPSAPTESLFERCETRVFLASGLEALGQVYWFRGSVEGLRRIESGDYLVDQSGRYGSSASADCD